MTGSHRVSQGLTASSQTCTCHLHDSSSTPSRRLLLLLLLQTHWAPMHRRLAVFLRRRRLGARGRKEKKSYSKSQRRVPLCLSLQHTLSLALDKFLVAVATQAKALRVPQRRVQQVSAASLSALLASSSHLISLSPSLTFCTSGLGRSIPASDCQPRSSRRRSQRLVFFF